MESLEELFGSLIAVDTAPLIYFIERYQPWLQRLLPFFRALDHGSFQAVTSTLTLAEVLVHPIRYGRPDIGEQYRDLLLGARHFKTIPVSAAVSEQAAELRSRFGLHTPDAIQLATAMQSGADWFLTNDKRLRIPGRLKVILVAELPTPSVSQ